MTRPAADLGELLERLALYLRRFEINGGRVTVEVVLGGRVVGLSQAVPEGEHDVNAIASEVLGDAVRCARALVAGAKLGSASLALEVLAEVDAIAEELGAERIAASRAAEQLADLVARHRT